MNKRINRISKEGSAAVKQGKKEWKELAEDLRIYLRKNIKTILLKCLFIGLRLGSLFGFWLVGIRACVRTFNAELMFKSETMPKELTVGRAFLNLYGMALFITLVICAFMFICTNLDWGIFKTFGRFLVTVHTPILFIGLVSLFAANRNGLCLLLCLMFVCEPLTVCAKRLLTFVKERGKSNDSDDSSREA